jgi:predicted aspartyl protease
VRKVNLRARYASAWVCKALWRWVFVGALLMAPQSPVGAAARNVSGELSLIGGYAFVDAYIDGGGPLRLLLDSGADSCALTPKAARALGLQYDYLVTMTTMTAAALAPASSHNRVRIGETERAGVEIAMLELPSIQQVDPTA